MKRRPLPSAEFLRECFRLEPETGKLYWRVRPVHHFRSSSFRSAQSTANNWNTIWAGQEALRTDSRGYLCGALDRKRVYAHRVIFKMLYGFEPNVIDHIDGDRANNRPSNLRDTSHAENCRNQRRSSRNRSGVTGVYWNPAMKKWRAVNPGRTKKTDIGHFSDFNDAVTARRAAERRLGYHPNHGRSKE
jgi:hypothetical protein